MQGLWGGRLYGRMVGASAERETVLESLGADTGGRGRILLVERHGLEGRDTERLPVVAHQDRGGAALLRSLSLGPGGDELITLVGDAHRLELGDALSLHRVVEACPEDRFGLAAGHLPLCLAVVAARGDEDGGGGDGEHGDRDDEHPRVVGVLLHYGVRGLRLGGRRAGRLVDGTGHF